MTEPNGMAEKANAADHIHASASYRAGMDVGEIAKLHGRYEAICRDKDGNELWRDFIDNVITTAGANLMLDTFFAGAAYTVIGPYMGLISSVSYAAGPVIGDTMSSHAGWTEAGGANAPTYSGARKTMVFSAAAAKAKALSTGLVYTFTGAGTVKGCFVVIGTGAVNTLDNTAGTLFSAGLFSGGDKVVGNTDTVTVSWSASV